MQSSSWDAAAADADGNAAPLAASSRRGRLRTCPGAASPSTICTSSSASATSAAPAPPSGCVSSSAAVDESAAAAFAPCTKWKPALRGVLDVEGGARAHRHGQFVESQRQVARELCSVVLVHLVGDALAELVVAPVDRRVVDRRLGEAQVLLDHLLEQLRHGEAAAVDSEHAGAAGADVAVAARRVEARGGEQRVALLARRQPVADAVPALVEGAAQQLEGLEHDEAGDDGVGRGDGRHNVAGDLLDVPARLARDVEDGRAQVGCGGDEVERVGVVLVERERANLGRALREHRLDRVQQHGRALLDGPHFGLLLLGRLGVGQRHRLQPERRRRSALLPQRVHREQPLDVRRVHAVEDAASKRGRALALETSERRRRRRGRSVARRLGGCTRVDRLLLLILCKRAPTRMSHVHGVDPARTWLGSQTILKSKASPGAWSWRSLRSGDRAGRMMRDTARAEGGGCGAPDSRATRLRLGRVDKVGVFAAENLLEEQLLGPSDAVDRLRHNKQHAQ
eukprot:1075061-Pleurochrysis_carterae.AAC.11